MNGEKFHTFMDYMNVVNVSGIIVPQRVVPPPPNFTPRAPIRFTTNGVAGVSIYDAAEGHIDALDNRHAVFPITNTSTRVTVRINWPGYDSWKFDNVLVYSEADGQTPRPFNLGRLAVAISKRIQRFKDDMHSAASTEPDWMLAKIHLERMFLVELRHVTAGSWQPVIAIV